MSYTATTMMLNLALAIGLAGGLTLTVATPSFARAPVPVHKRHQSVASAAAQQRRQSHESAGSAYGSVPPADLCRQTGPITMPATNPICNRQGWFMD
jgi:hypothetical protein